MEKTALALRRPKNFTEVVGQSITIRMLSYALENNRLHHAYLFSGKHGIGKTTFARILAKCFNCEKGITKDPCGKCPNCKAIEKGNFMDFWEIDAASRTKVEDTREILENVQYKPVQGRFKVYLIDEVHMLSGHSFNALLKTLEEPPEHVKFLLATTDPKKLPNTVLSRCLQFHLQPLSNELIIKHLESNLKQDSIEYEMPALERIAEAANGSMRDALSTLDQAIAYGEGKVFQTDVEKMLGVAEHTYILEILNCLCEKNGEKLIEIIEGLAIDGVHFGQLLSDFLNTLQKIAILQTTEVQQTESIQSLANTINPEDIQLYYQIALLGKRDLPLAPNPKVGFTMTLIRMLAFQPNLREKSTPKTSIAGSNTSQKQQPTEQKPKEIQSDDSLKQAPQKKISQPPINHQNDWHAIADQLEVTGISKVIANNCSLVSNDDKSTILKLTKKHEALLTDNAKNRLEQALQKYFSNQAKLTIELVEQPLETPATKEEERKQTAHQSAVTAIANNEHIQTMVEKFGVTVDENSIKAHD